MYAPNDPMYALKNEPIAVSEQVQRFVGRIYSSPYSRAGFGLPIWECEHEHDHPNDAQLCANQELRRVREQNAQDRSAQGEGA